MPSNTTFSHQKTKLKPRSLAVLDYLKSEKNIINIPRHGGGSER
jgi:hypothetical protein